MDEMNLEQKLKEFNEVIGTPGMLYDFDTGIKVMDPATRGRLDRNEMPNYRPGPNSGRGLPILGDIGRAVTYWFPLLVQYEKSLELSNNPIKVLGICVSWDEMRMGKIIDDIVNDLYPNSSRKIEYYAANPEKYGLTPDRGNDLPNEVRETFIPESNYFQLMYGNPDDADWYFQAKYGSPDHTSHDIVREKGPFDIILFANCAIYGSHSTIDLANTFKYMNFVFPFTREILKHPGHVVIYPMWNREMNKGTIRHRLASPKEDISLGPDTTLNEQFLKVGLTGKTINKGVDSYRFYTSV